MKRNKWDAQIPQTPKRQHKKRLYFILEPVKHYWYTHELKVVWLTNKQLTFYRLDHPESNIGEVLRKETLEACKKPRYWNAKLSDEGELVRVENGKFSEKML